MNPPICSKVYGMQAGLSTVEFGLVDVFKVFAGAVWDGDVIFFLLGICAPFDEI